MLYVLWGSTAGGKHVLTLLSLRLPRAELLCLFCRCAGLAATCYSHYLRSLERIERSSTSGQSCNAVPLKGRRATLGHQHVDSQEKYYRQCLRTDPLRCLPPVPLAAKTPGAVGVRLTVFCSRREMLLMSPAHTTQT